MATVTIHEAKTHLSRLIARMHQGEEIIIAKGKHPQAKLVPLDNKRKLQRRFGTLGPISEEEADEAARPLPKEYWGYISEDED